MKANEETIALRKERNRAINAKFTEYLKQGMGFMDAYEKTARDFGCLKVISETSSQAENRGRARLR